MSAAEKKTELPDAAERERAVATFERNLVVTAGAGTGKTTLLVDRLVYLLLRNPEPLRITEIVALTFTNKAANEMKLRLRDRLQSYLAVQLDREPATVAESKARRDVESLRARYQLSKDEIDRRVHDALKNLERSEIGTIHSFAATLLRLYPLEAGVDPQFGEDDGKQFDRLFDEQWGLWLDRELSLEGDRTDAWRNILAKVALDQVKALAISLSAETVELRRNNTASGAVPAAIHRWLTELESRAAALLDRHPEDRTNEKLVRAARRIIQEFRESAQAWSGDASEATTLIVEKSVSARLKGWSEEDIGEAQELVRAARGLCRIDAELTGLLWNVLVPFAEHFREYFVREGFVSFDGLLIRARNLVRDRVRVREELKRQYRTILIDEFQDTDPIQYEILLYLAEQEGASAKDWRQIKLAPGKVFVVGDPKQSIYAFRRADIQAYLDVVEKIIKAQDGIECRLTTNFRSTGGILDVVNGLFSSLIRRQEGVQPEYIAIHPAPARPPAAEASLPAVVVRKIVAPDEEMNAEIARRLEGESLARWLKDAILNKAVILDSGGERVHVQPRDVAILFRKLTDIHDYLESFRRLDIRYVVEGERHFYAAKEIIDAVNLLRAIENPHDRLALVGVLRSPLGGLTDREIYELYRANLLDYRKTDDFDKVKDAPALAELYRIMEKLHNETRLLPVGEAVSQIFASLPLKLLAACCFHGEQAVANLEKLRQQAILLGQAGLTTLKEAIRQLEERVLDVKEEGESVLAEENIDAVRIMSIHKAKGLEFPVVILAGCHTGIDGRLGNEADALFDWSTGLAGLRVGQTWDLPGLYIAEKTRIRAEEEQKRVLYVAMTRAREHLIVSCAPTGRRMGGSFLAMLDECAGAVIETAEDPGKIAVGNGSIDIQVLTQSLAAPGQGRRKTKNRRKKPNWRAFSDAWQKRRERYESVLKRPQVLTPTLLKQQDKGGDRFRPFRSGSDREPALLLGNLAHRFLQTWDFGAEVNNFSSHLRPFLERWLPEEARNQRDAVGAELETILGNFFDSPAYAELAGARILGREVPLLMPWNGQIMEGVIDLIYERDGLLYLADYKTDRITKDQLAEGAARYSQQGEIYSQAVRQSLGREPAAFKIIFLRLGEAVELGVEKSTELSIF
ncbi:MAG TPA: UvrD-helicase domain-containing protein [Verrucomicrobiae bacterium]|nr:UvrD-helicase domain-containing protein [Verrucomicrobiae bacterium]